MKTIDHEDDISNGLKVLKKLDPRLIPVIDLVPNVPLRKEQGGFPGLARIIIGQHVSTASASAIHGRFLSEINKHTPKDYLSASEETLIKIGLTRAKQATLRTVCENILDGNLDLGAIEKLPAEEAIKKLTSLKGVGPWTAEVYLLFCAGHPDIFAAGDLAVREAVRSALSLSERPLEKDLRQIALQWSPQRGVATRLFWSYYEFTKGTGKGLPL